MSVLGVQTEIVKRDKLAGYSMGWVLNGLTATSRRSWMVICYILNLFSIQPDLKHTLLWWYVYGRTQLGNGCRA